MPTLIYTFCLGYSATDCAAACSASCTTYYSDCPTLILNCSLYTDNSGSVAPDGYYSDGVDCYHLVTPPVTPTPTPTPTSTPISVNSGDVFYGCLPQFDPCGNLGGNSYLYWSGAFGSGTVLYTDITLTTPWGGVLGCDTTAICHIDGSSVGSLATFNIATGGNVVGSIYDSCGEFDAEIEFTIQDNGGGEFEVYMTLISGYIYDTISATGGVEGYTDGACSVASTQTGSFTTIYLDPGGVPNYNHAYLLENPFPDWVTRKITGLLVLGDTMNAITTSPQNVVLNGHTYKITGYGICNTN